jgi:hypothetical protein
VAGLIDGTAENATDVTQLLSLVEKMINDKQERDAILQAFSKLTKEQIWELAKKLFTEPLEKLGSLTRAGLPA